ncbi:MAG: mercury resistance system transport protein MerF [Rhodospirillales bacterium]|nr:mercury resistance system transport protein MerF [Rhodospirillales bacterium]
MKDRTLVKTGLIGSAFAAICCFTPFLVILLGAIGLSSWLGWLDYVLVPSLAMFVVITGFGIWRLKSN